MIDILSIFVIGNGARTVGIDFKEWIKWIKIARIPYMRPRREPIWLLNLASWFVRTYPLPPRVVLLQTTFHNNKCSKFIHNQQTILLILLLSLTASPSQSPQLLQYAQNKEKKRLSPKKTKSSFHIFHFSFALTGLPSVHFEPNTFSQTI